MKKVLITGLILIFVPFTAFGDVVVLKDGRRFTGEIIEETDQFVRIKTEKGKVLRIRSPGISEISRKKPDVTAEQAKPLVDTVVLKNRRKYTGRIIEETHRLVRIRINDGTVRKIDRIMIAKISRAAPRVENGETEEAEEGIGKAELTLSRLAEGMRSGRMAAGVLGLVLGIPTTAGGIVLARNEGAPGAVLAGAGLGVAGLGVFAISVKSSAEKRYESVKGIDATMPEAKSKREYAAEAALHDLAQGAKRVRMIVGTTICASGLFFLVFQPFEDRYILGTKVSSGNAQNMQMGLMLIGTGTVPMVIKSAQERAYEKYLKDKGKEGQLNFEGGLTPACVWASLFYRF